MNFRLSGRKPGPPFDPRNADDPRHGTVSAYKNLGCRCGKCTKAASDYQRNYTQKKNKDKPQKAPVGRGPRKPRSGPVTTYRIDPETGEKVLVDTSIKAPARLIKNPGRGRNVVGPETLKPTKRLGKCGSLSGFREHNLNGERHCKECLQYMDRHPELDQAECGTREGYQRHIDQGYKPCNACIAANKRLNNA